LLDWDLTALSAQISYIVASKNILQFKKVKLTRNLKILHVGDTFFIIASCYEKNLKRVVECTHSFLRPRPHALTAGSSAAARPAHGFLFMSSQSLSETDRSFENQLPSVCLHTDNTDKVTYFLTT